MYQTTGFCRETITNICVMINAATATEQKKPWPPILGLYKSAVVALTYMRRNRAQAEIAETFGVSQSTISRAVATMTPLLGCALHDFVPTADELDDSEQLVVGTLLPC